MTVELGGMLPDLTLIAPDGGVMRLRDFIGEPLIVYFYPKADTPGCTREAQDFGALADRFAGAGAAVLGVSRDTAAKLDKFAKKYDLAVPLASDEAGAVTEAFGVWVKKSMYGRSYMGIERSTWLFDAAGKAVRIWRPVRVPGHAEEVLAAVKALD